MAGARTRSIFAFAALASTLAGCGIYFAGPGNKGYIRRSPSNERIGDADSSTSSINGQQLVKVSESLMRSAKPRGTGNAQRTHVHPIPFLMMLCFITLAHLVRHAWNRMAADPDNTRAVDGFQGGKANAVKALTGNPHVLATCIVLSLTLAGGAIHFGGSGAPGGYMRNVAHHADPIVASPDDQVQLAYATDLLEHRSRLMRSAKPSVTGAHENSERDPCRPLQLLLIVCAVAALTAFAHHVWGSALTTQTDAMTRQSSMIGNQTQSLTRNPRLLIVIVAVALTLAGCALYVGGSDGVPGGYARRVPRHGTVSDSAPTTFISEDHAQAAKAPEVEDHLPGMVRRVKPRAAGLLANHDQALGRPVNFFFMLCIVATFTGFAHQVWGSIRTNHADPKVSQRKGNIAALTRDPRFLLAFIALALTLVWCALYFEGPAKKGAIGGYMRRVPRPDGVIDATADVTPNVSITQVLFVACVFAALHAFTYQVWGRMMTLHRSSADPKVSKA